MYQYVLVVQTVEGELAVRYATDAYTRTRVLAKHGVTVLYVHDAGQAEHVEELMQQTMDVVERDELVEYLVPVHAEARRVGFMV